MISKENHEARGDEMLAWGIAFVVVGSAFELAGIIVGGFQIRAAAQITRKFLSSVLFRVVATFPVAWNVPGSASLTGGGPPSPEERCDRIEARLAATEARLSHLENELRSAQRESEQSADKLKQALTDYVADMNRGIWPTVAVALLAAGAVLQAIGGVLCAAAHPS